MRIGIDIRSLTEEGRTGVVEYTNNLLLNLLKIDQRNEYFLFYNAFHPLRNRLIQKFDFPNVKIKTLKVPNKIFHFSIIFLKYPLLDKLIGGVDLFFAPNLQFLSLSSDCKKVITFHDLSFELYPHFYSLKQRLWHQIINPRALAQKFDKIIAVSENTKNDLINIYKLDPSKIKVIYSGLNKAGTQDLNPEELDKIRKKYKLPSKFILSLSTLEPRKNLESLILAFDNFISKYHLDYQLVIAGSRGWSENRVYKISKRINHPERVKFLGPIAEKEKPYLYKLAHLFVYLSFYEGFGFPPLESLTAGTPVITSNTSSLPEVLGSGALLVDPYNLNEISEVIYHNLIDNRLRESLIHQGQKRIKNFDWIKTAQETLALFESMI